jgi:hypothetical protein
MIRPLLVALAIVAAGPPEKSLSIFVDPQTRDGFIDVDRGVLDSLNDIKSELRTKTRFRVVADKDQADLILEAISRGATSTNGGGTAAIPIGAINLNSYARLMPLSAKPGSAPSKNWLRRSAATASTSSCGPGAAIRHAACRDKRRTRRDDSAEQFVEASRRFEGIALLARCEDNATAQHSLQYGTALCRGRRQQPPLRESVFHHNSRKTRHRTATAKVRVDGSPTRFQLP